MDLLVSHSRGCYRPARQEIARTLGRLGDAQPHIGKSGVPGIVVVHTAIDNRHVVARCAERYRAEPEAFRFAIKWVPVDGWCAKDLDAMRRMIKEQVLPRIGARDTWAMKVEKRGWEQYHTTDIIRYLAEAIDRKVNLETPDRIVRVDILRDAVAISLLRPDEVFSIHAASR